MTKKSPSPYSKRKARAARRGRGKEGAVGYANPPRSTRFPPGRSGNPNGRPKGSKNLQAALQNALRERARDENGRRKRISKREAIAQQVVDKAASGDLRAAQTVFNQERLSEAASPNESKLEVFDTPEHRLVIADIVRRIRQMEEPPPIDANPQQLDTEKNDASDI